MQCKRAYREVEEHLVGSSIAQAFPRAVIEPVYSVFDLLPGHPEQAALLGKELAQQPIGVLVEAALPRAIGMCKVHPGIQALANERVLGELFSIVKGQWSCTPVCGDAVNRQ